MMRSIGFGLAAVAGLALVFAAGLPFGTRTTEAAIHELVGSFCSVGGGNQLEPPGQTRDGQSFLRALQATGVFDVTFGAEPDDTPDPFAITIRVDNSHPASKVSWDGFSFDVFIEGPFTIYIAEIILDHPASEHCKNLQP